MKTASASLFVLGFAILSTLAAACSSPSSSNPGTGGSSQTGTAGTTGAGGSISCNSGQMVCNGSCIDTTSDSNNCGGCGIPCLGGHSCQSGTCQCASGLLECNGSCVASDATHCGSCSMACTGTQVCTAGQCTSTCAGTMCGTACCTSSQTCTNNACVDMGGPGTGGSGGTTGAGGSGTGTGGRGGTTGAGGTAGSGTGGRGGTTGTGGTAGSGTGGSTPAGPKVITSASGAFWNTNVTVTMPTSGNANVTVNDSTSRQTWEGFGGAFNEAGWVQIKKLSASDQTKALQALFGTDGAHFVMGRIPIGASDYAINRYTEDETSGDTNLTSFNITQDMVNLIPYVQAAMAQNGSIRFWASPWTVPTWMKTRSGSSATTSISCGNPMNGTMTDSNVFDGGCMQAGSGNANLNALANYFAKWITAYKGMGITIDTLAPQNEPGYSQGYPSTIWDPATYKTFLPMLKSALSTAGLSTKIMLGTMSNGDSGSTSKDLQVVQAVMQDSSAKTVPTVMGLQWGMLDLYEGKTSGVGPSNFMTGSMPVWATEHKCGNYPWNPGGGIPNYVEPAPNDLAYGHESWGYIVDAINKGGVTAYNAWNMVLDSNGKGNDLIRQWSQDALLVVNGTSLTLSPAYYAFRHASQYAAVGAKVISGTNDSFVAFKNPDGSEVVALYNSGGANANYIVQIKGTKYQFSMPGSGWATVVVP